MPIPWKVKGYDEVGVAGVSIIIFTPPWEASDGAGEGAGDGAGVGRSKVSFTSFQPGALHARIADNKARAMRNGIKLRLHI